MVQEQISREMAEQFNAEKRIPRGRQIQKCLQDGMAEHLEGNERNQQRLAPHDVHNLVIDNSTQQLSSGEVHPSDRKVKRFRKALKDFLRSGNINGMPIGYKWVESSHLIAA